MHLIFVKIQKFKKCLVTLLWQRRETVKRHQLCKGRQDCLAEIPDNATKVLCAININNKPKTEKELPADG